MSQKLDTSVACRFALIREVSDGFQRCTLRPGLRGGPNVALARSQHGAFARLLRDSGVRAIPVPTEPTLPEASFVDDVAVVLDRRAVLGRSTLFSRAGEADGVREALERYRTVDITPVGAHLDGGDVIRIGRTLYVAMSERTDAAGVAFLERVARLDGFTVRPVTSRTHHLKASCSYLGRGVLLHAAGKIHPADFEGLQLLCAPEADGANVLAVNDRLLVPAEAQRTCEFLTRKGFAVEPVALSEFLRAHGGPSSLALLIPDGSN